VQIIVRIRGLGQVLSMIIGKALGRKVNGDVDEAPNIEGP